MVTANFRLVLAVAAIAAVAMACATPRRTDDGSPRQMSTENIETLLIGNFLSNGSGELGTQNTIELFCEQGRWARFAGQYVNRGQYSIVGSSVCVRREGQPAWCRDFYRSSDGQLFVQDAASGERRTVTTTRGPSDATCTSGAEP
jgi:hypothetical protein